MVLYKNVKAMVRLLDGNTDFFDIVAEVSQGDILVPYIFITSLDYLFQTSINT